MSFKVRIEKQTENCSMTIDGKDYPFSSEASNLLTSTTASCVSSGIFSKSSTCPSFSRGDLSFYVEFGSPFFAYNFTDPAAEVHRRVKLVRETFTKAEAEKEVWEVEIGVEPIVSKAKPKELLDWFFKGAQVSCCHPNLSLPARPVTLGEIYKGSNFSSGFGAVDSGCLLDAFWFAPIEVIEPEEQPEVFTIIYVNEYGSCCRDTITLRESELPECLSSYANPSFVFRGDHESV